MIASKTTYSKIQHYTEAIVVGVGATSVSYAVAALFNWLDPAETSLWLSVEVFAVFTSYVCTWLCVRQRRINYPIGSISSVAYALLFWHSHLMASAIINAYLVGALVYGWWRWRPDADARPVTLVAARMWPVYLVVTGVAYLGAVGLVKAIGGVLVWTDTVILIGTLLAQFLLDNKKLENWVIWFVVDVFAIWTYAGAHLYLVLFQYVLFLANTAIGFEIWRRDRATSIHTDDRAAADHGSSAADPVR
jgi:nicotinamide mononucleotide transporter